MRRLLLNSVSAVLAASVVAGVASVGASAQSFETSGNATIVSDYRFRGVSQSFSDPAIQGGLDLTHESGFYVGTWGSSVSNFGNGSGQGSEIDLYAGFSGEAGPVGFDAGVLTYYYPGGDNAEALTIFEGYGSVSAALGPVEATAGFAYVPEQNDTGDLDNTYVYTGGSLPIGEFLSVSAQVGYTFDEGFWDFGAGDDGLWDYSVGVSTSVLGLDLGASYVATSEDYNDWFDDTVVFSIGKSF